ncbi:hypothetical protein I3843_15G157200 [Carya illinoinensis]|uniref:Stress induced protein n=1 Tax=Carya illinoinensis TaxID=32201 RepID=A0A8T1NE59_CARIL|nr:uncharacterized protein LOC122296447 [Carya illinoinensis]KAG2668478.1 hypothetical protein I3760_15G162800 [Carya illinoinensis]KAG6628152.1 hypothetical protein CIPAW_15G181700 [Carya illinoinensis]KAG6676720.1 hypothetical protein I3842_15G165700 [Carya illinoinensis]KAG7945532.1 hypothetical protein I3843_15G157200 [Carya illinoinensis]
MASIEEKPLKVHEEGDEDHMNEHEEAVSSGGCCCLGLMGFRWGQSNERESKHLLQVNKGERKETWWMKQLIKVKQGTEFVAGPKWKTFLRKISAFGNHKNKKKHGNGFQYDPQAYALNFDNGFDDGDQEDGFVLDFRSRFAATPS